MSTFDRIERDVLTQKQRNKNRIREHSKHGWHQIRNIGNIVLMDCPCGWLGWIATEGC